MATYVRNAHRCGDELPYPCRGDIVACSCGKWWRASCPGNPAYDGWRRAWLRQLLSRKGSSRG